jgi:ankyrin repeat protein
LGNEAEALETLRLNPGFVNDTWDWETFRNGGGEWGEWAKDEYQGVTAIMAASFGGSEGLMRELLRLGAEVNAFSANGVDALMCASRYGHAAAVAVLLDNGADPNTQSKNCSALGGAAFYDHLPVCQLLLGRGADLLAVNAYHSFGGYSDSALEVYGSFGSQRLTPAILEERREALRVAFAEGPHESQVQRRRD